MWTQKVGGGVMHAVFAPDGRTLYTTDAGGWVRAWDTATHDQRRLFQLTPLERMNARDTFLVGGGRYLVVPVLSYARGWKVEEGEPLPTLPECVTAGRLQAAGARAVRFISRDQMRISSHDVLTWQPDADLQRPADLGNVLWWAAAPDDSAMVWADANSRMALTRVGEPPVPLKPPAGRVFNACFTPAGDTLVWLLDDGIQIWDARLLSVRVEQVKCYMPYWVFALNPRLPVFAAMNPQRQLTLFSLETGQPVRSLDFALGLEVLCVAFAPDGLTCAVGGSNKQFAVFDVGV